MADNFDVKIQVVYPYLTKSLNNKDRETVKAIGTFKFESRPQVETATSGAVQNNFVKAKSAADRAQTLKDKFGVLLSDLEKVEEVIKKRAGHITLKYNPELTENEALTNAEETVFGYPSGEITYARFKETIDFLSKVDKYISHQNVENQGVLSGVA